MRSVNWTFSLFLKVAQITCVFLIKLNRRTIQFLNDFWRLFIETQEQICRQPKFFLLLIEFWSNLNRRNRKMEKLFLQRSYSIFPQNQSMHSWIGNEEKLANFFAATVLFKDGETLDSKPADNSVNRCCRSYSHMCRQRKKYGESRTAQHFSIDWIVFRSAFGFSEKILRKTMRENHKKSWSNVAIEVFAGHGHFTKHKFGRQSTIKRRSFQKTIWFICWIRVHKWSL